MKLFDNQWFHIILLDGSAGDQGDVLPLFRGAVKRDVQITQFL
jgi:hypothetical protein